LGAVPIEITRVHDTHRRVRFRQIGVHRR
jgi:hypothetical protein